MILAMTVDVCLLDMAGRYWPGGQGSARTVETDNGEDEAQTENQDNNGVDPQAGALVSVELEHRAGRTTSTGGAGRAGSGIADGLLVVSGRAPTQSSPGTTRRSGRGRTVDGGDGRGAGTSASRLGVGTGLSTGGQGGSSTGRSLRGYRS